MQRGWGGRFCSVGQFPLDRLVTSWNEALHSGTPQHDTIRCDMMWHAYQLISPSGRGIVCVCVCVSHLVAGLGNPRFDYHKIQEWKTDCKSWMSPGVECPLRCVQLAEFIQIFSWISCEAVCRGAAPGCSSPRQPNQIDCNAQIRFNCTGING